MSNDNTKNQTAMLMAITGMILEAMSETVADLSKELKKHAGDDFNKRLDLLENNAIKAIHNAPIDGIPEDLQVMAIDFARTTIRSVFNRARRA